MLPSLHDSLVLGFAVQCDTRTIRIDFQLPENNERVALNFSEVLAYHFEDDAFGNIVGEFEEVPASDIYIANSKQISESFHRSGAPGPWAETPDSALGFLRANSARGFSLLSYIGLSCWVIAKGCSRAV